MNFFITQVNEDGNVLHLNSSMINLCFNSNHFDIITIPRKFTGNHKTCFKCMKYLTQPKIEFIHVCRTDESRQKCYTSTSKCKGNEQIECRKSHIFLNHTCSSQHLLNKIFASMKKNIKLTPYNYF